MKNLAISVVLLLFLSGCALNPEMKELKAENESLTGKLAQAELEINQLNAQKNDLQVEMQKIKGIMSVLNNEKSSRKEESSRLRSQAREFIQTEMRGFKKFLQNSDLLDYIGDELVSRSKTTEASQLIVDVGNPVPRSGSITGVGVYVSSPTQFYVKILRPVEEKLVCIWESELIDAQNSGLFKYFFNNTIGVEGGDYIGYYFPERNTVYFDEGTGQTLYKPDKTPLGSFMPKSSLDGKRSKRAFSIGVYGLLN